MVFVYSHYKRFGSLLLEETNVFNYSLTIKIISDPLFNFGYTQKSDFYEK